MTDDRAILRMLFDAAVAASKPAACMPLWLEDRPAGNVIVVGAGKAAASMAAILEQQWAKPLMAWSSFPTDTQQIASTLKLSKPATRFPMRKASPQPAEFSNWFQDSRR